MADTLSAGNLKTQTVDIIQDEKRGSSSACPCAVCSAHVDDKINGINAVESVFDCEIRLVNARFETMRARYAVLSFYCVS